MRVRVEELGGLQNSESLQDGGYRDRDREKQWAESGRDQAQ